MYLRMQSMLFRREENRQSKEFDDTTSYNVSHMPDDFDFQSSNQTANLDMSGFSEHSSRKQDQKSASNLRGTYSAIKS